MVETRGSRVLPEPGLRDRVPAAASAHESGPVRPGR
jgi:hypothetical protein